jgi:hypothetical protein
MRSHPFWACSRARVWLGVTARRALSCAVVWSNMIGQAQLDRRGADSHAAARSLDERLCAATPTAAASRHLVLAALMGLTAFMGSACQRGDDRTALILYCTAQVGGRCTHT